MTQIEVKVELLPNFGDLSLPEYRTEHSAGIDLSAAISENIIIKSGSSALIPTGMKMEIPEGYELQIRPRSGLALKSGITVLNTPGTIDPDYRGEIAIILINHSSRDFTVEKGMRIAQGVFGKIEKARFTVVEHVGGTARGEGGFGHTGLK